MQNIQNHYWVSQTCILLGLVLGQRLPGSIRKSWTRPSSRQDLDFGMHELESRSGLQAAQWAGSFSEGGHGRREWDPCDPQALNWVWHAWHGAPCWSISRHLSCLPLPASATLYDSSLVGPKSSINDLGCYRNNYKQGPFSAFLSYHYLSVTVNIRCYQLWSGECLKSATSFRKMQLLRRTSLKGKFTIRE